MPSPPRGAVPVIGTLLLVAIVVVLGVTVSTVAIGVGGKLSDPAPAAAIEANTDDKTGTVQFKHIAGDAVDPANIAIRNGEMAAGSLASKQFRAGDTIRVIPENNTERISLVYDGTQTSTILAQAAMQSSVVNDTTFDLEPSGQAQFDFLTSIDLASGIPETNETESRFGIVLRAVNGNGEPLDNVTVTVDITVTNHLGTEPFTDAPNNALSGSTKVAFEDGRGSFTVGGEDAPDADLSLGFLGFLPGVNDVETIELAVGDNVTITDRTLTLTPGNNE